MNHCLIWHYVLMREKTLPVKPGKLNCSDGSLIFHYVSVLPLHDILKLMLFIASKSKFYYCNNISPVRTNIHHQTRQGFTEIISLFIIEYKCTPFIKINSPTHWWNLIEFPTTLFVSKSCSGTEPWASQHRAQVSIPNFWVKGCSHTHHLSQTFSQHFCTLCISCSHNWSENLSLWLMSVNRGMEAEPSDSTEHITMAGQTASLNSQTSIYFTGLLCISWKYHM